MKCKTGLVLGLGIGYLLGARAGRERYEQIRTIVAEVLGDERLRAAGAVAERWLDPVRRRAGEGLVTAAQVIRSRADAASGDATQLPSR
jgi:hypothetical protein